MSFIVQKYGGTSVGNPERIRNVASRVAESHKAGHRLVVVVSAMSGVTDSLIKLAREVNPEASAREVDVLRLIAGGNANKEIAAQLSITEETVKGYVKNILAKLGAKDRTHAVTIGLKRGVIDL